MLGPVLYSIFTSDLPQNSKVTIATFADDTALMASSPDPVEASQFLQDSLNEVQEWLNKWRIKASASKSVHITFALRRGNCPSVKLGDQQLPHNDSVKYLGMYLDRKLTWKDHIRAKRDQLNIRFRELYWLLGRNSVLSLDNKLLIYKTVLKPIWTYGIQLWGSACKSNVTMIQRAEDSILKKIANTPWFIKNSEVHHHLNINTVKEEIRSYSAKYKGRLRHHPNQLAGLLTEPDRIGRLKRRGILELDQLT